MGESSAEELKCNSAAFPQLLFLSMPSGLRPLTPSLPCPRPGPPLTPTHHLTATSSCWHVCVNASSLVLDRRPNGMTVGYICLFPILKRSRDTRERKPPLPAFVCWRLAGSTICSQLWEFSSATTSPSPNSYSPGPRLHRRQLKPTYPSCLFASLPAPLSRHCPLR